MKKTLLTAIAITGFALSLSALAAACQQEVAASQEASAAAPAKAAAAKHKIARIVFVGKQNACACTRKRVDDSWGALQKALGTPAKLPVEQLQIDIDGAKVEPYRNQKAMMTLPAIYFVDGADKVLALLQGEVTEAEISVALKR